MKPTTGNYVFDLHCDTITECYKRGVGLSHPDLDFSLSKLPEGYHICQCMAVFIPDNLRGQGAVRFFDQVAAFFRGQLAEHHEQMALVEDTAGIIHLLDGKRFAAMLTVEGGAVLAGEVNRVEALHKEGVRMMTLTWNGANEICGGAATDQGFTSFGRQVVAEMENRRMVVDVSHLSDTGFWELCHFAKRPFVASHSNSRAVCDHRRNLTDGMFGEIRDRGGLVGVNYYDAFIREGGGSSDISDLLRHIHHFLELGGENTLALGSDFDGAGMPPYLKGLQCIRPFREALLESGLSVATVKKLFFENARRFFAPL